LRSQYSNKAMYTGF